MTTSIELTQNDKVCLGKVLKHLDAWCADNPIPAGVCQVAAGAALVSLGVHCGAIEIGAALLATHVPVVNPGGAMGLIGGAVGGGWAGSLLGGIGIAAAGTAIGIPAAIVVGGAACVFGLAGYAVGDIAHNLMFQAVDPLSLVMPGSLLVVGTYLMIKGALKVLDGMGMLAPLRAGIHKAKNSILTLNPISAEIVARTKVELAGFAAEWTTPPQSSAEVSAASATIAACGAGGLAAGSAIASGSVMLMGSSTLGSFALSAGLISAPLWPVIAGVAVAGGLGYTAFKAARYVLKKPAPARI